jgi:hypothetical protein
MIELRLSELHAERPELSHPADAFIGVTARFEITADGTAVYSEDEFPVIELAAELGDWLRSGLDASRDFEFDSMSTPEAGWVWIRHTGSGWRVGSLHQDRPDTTVRGDSEIRTAVERFIEAVKESAVGDLGLDVTPFVEGGAP